MQCISVKQGPFLGTDYDKVNVEVKKLEIPVFEPVIGDDEIDAVTAALRRGEISGNFGKALDQFESEFRGLLWRQIWCSREQWHNSPATGCRCCRDRAGR